MRLFSSKLFLAAAVAATVAVGMGVGRVIVQNRELAREIASLQAESAGLEAKNAEFVELVKRFQTDAFLEREARVKLNLQKSGEVAYAVRAGEAVVSSGPVETATDGEGANARRWWRYFFAPDSQPEEGPQDSSQ